MATSLALMWIRMRTALRKRHERGASLVEYALLVALIALVCIVAVTLLGLTTSHKFSQVGSYLQ
jgi:pilus assembly protein Flp/PilA